MENRSWNGPQTDVLTHWGRVTHICVVKLTIIGSDNGLSPGRRQAIIWTYAGIMLIGPLGTNFIEILIGIQTFSFKKMHLKMSSAKWRPFCLGINVLIGLSMMVKHFYWKYPLQYTHVVHLGLPVVHLGINYQIHISCITVVQLC